MRKLNKKGFTLTEILATIAILGVVLAIAVPSYNSLSKKFEKSYYEKLEGSILAAAQTYYKDNSNLRPSELLHTAYIEIGDLIKNNYIESANSYKSDKALEGYAIIINVGSGTYDYKVCAKNSDASWYSYDKSKLESANDPDNYCNEAWTKESLVVNYSDINTSPSYLYLDKDYEATKSNSDVLRLKLGTYPTASVYSLNNKLLKSVSEDGPMVYPNNISSISLKKTDNYLLTYVSGSRNLAIVQYPAPKVSTNDTVVTLSLDENVKELFQKLGTNFLKYQQSISTDGGKSWSKWQDINCYEGQSCVVTYEKKDYDNTNQIQIKYRFMDDDTDGKYQLASTAVGNISAETGDSTTINFDESVLTVTAHEGSLTGNDYNGNKWTNNDIYFAISGKNIEFSYKIGNNDWIDEEKILDSLNTNVSKNSFLDTTYYFADRKVESSTYTKNTPLSKNVKVDKSSPEITLQLYDEDGNKYTTGSSKWTTKNLVLVATVVDKGSGIKEVKYGTTILTRILSFDSYEGDKYSRVYFLNLDSNVENIYVEATDYAGNEATANISPQIDKSSPWCFISKDTTDKELKVYAGDIGSSGIKSVSINPSLTKKVICLAKACYTYSNPGTYIATVKDKAGNSTTCKTTIADESSTTPVEETLTAPTIHLSSTTQTTSNVTFTLTNPNSSGTLQYSYDQKTWTNYGNNEVTLLNETGSKTVYARVVNGTNTSSVSQATGYCNKDGVSVSPSDLSGTYFQLGFSLLNNPSGVTSGKFEYFYWGAESTTDTTNNQSTQAKTKCKLPSGTPKTTTNSTTAKLYMKYQKQYYCFAVRPYRANEISTINRWTIQRKHAITSQTVDKSKYNGVS